MKLSLKELELIFEGLNLLGDGETDYEKLKSIINLQARVNIAITNASRKK